MLGAGITNGFGERSGQSPATAVGREAGAEHLLSAPCSRAASAACCEY